MNPNASLIQNQLTAWFLRRTPTNGVRRVVSVSAAIASDRGNVREENQDRAAIARGKDRQGRGYALVAVADGIGGMQDGGTCAAMTIGAFVAAVDQLAKDTPDSSDRSEDWLRQAAHAANQVVFAKFRASGGSTLVALLVRPGYPACWLSVGDSRIYCIDEKTITQISIDDTIAGQLGKNPEEASEQSLLLQFVGMGPDLEPHIAKLDVNNAEALVLTTDGVHYLAPTPGWLGQIVRNAPDPGVCVKRLVDLAKWCGGPDNATVAMITLPAGLESENSLPYACLELWDAYGELQIVCPAPVREPSSTLAGNPITAQGVPAIRDAPAPCLEPAIDERVSSPTLGQSKPRRGKAPRKSKKSPEKRNEDSDKHTEPELPQLHMEFPTKSN